MGLKALVDYAVIKELCDKLKRDEKTFTGKVKGKFDKNERPSESIFVNDSKKLSHLQRRARQYFSVNFGWWRNIW